MATSHLPRRRRRPRLLQGVADRWRSSRAATPSRSHAEGFVADGIGLPLLAGYAATPRRSACRSREPPPARSCAVTPAPHGGQDEPGRTGLVPGRDENRLLHHGRGRGQRRHLDRERRRLRPGEPHPFDHRGRGAGLVADRYPDRVLEGSREPRSQRDLGHEHRRDRRHAPDERSDPWGRGPGLTTARLSRSRC